MPLELGSDIGDESWRPDAASLEKFSDEIHGLFFPPAPAANMERFKAQVQAAIEYQKRHDDARAELERREQKHMEMVKQDPRLRNHQAGPPKKGWEWARLFVVDEATPIQQGAWVPPGFPTESALPPEPFPSNPSENIPWEVLLTGKYVVLAVVHDDADTNPNNERGRRRLLTDFDLPLSFCMMRERGPNSHPDLNVHGFRFKIIECALKDVKADLASVGQGTDGGAATKATPKNLLDWAGNTDATLTIVYTDIKGSTQMGVCLGNEKMEVLRKVHFAQARHLAESTGGYLFKTDGDGCIAAFHTTSDALWFSLALREDPGDACLRIRAGVHVGPVKISEHDADGTAMNYTARLLDEARPANVCLSDEAKKHIDQRGDRRLAAVTFTKRPNCELKGFPEKQTLWFAEAARTSRSSSSQGAEFAKPMNAPVYKSIFQWVWSFIKAVYGFTVEKVAKGTTDSITKRP